jgi:hypothetical protein
MDDNGILNSSWNSRQVNNFFDWMESPSSDEEQRRIYWECVEEDRDELPPQNDNKMEEF